MSLRRASGAALFLSAVFLQAGCVFNAESVLPPDAPGVEVHASRPKELAPDRTAELCQAAAEELEKQGLNADAVTQYEKARRLDPKRGPVVAHRLAVLYDRLGDDAHALAAYKEALAAAPHDADLLNDFGYFHYQRGELDEADKCFRQALDANHAHLRAAVNLGLTLGKEGKTDASLEAFRQVLPASEAYCNVGVLLAQQGKAADARRSLEQALHLEPGLKQARVVLDHLDAIAAAAQRPTPVLASQPPPIQQAVAPLAPPTMMRQASYTADAPPLHRETAVPVTPLPTHRESVLAAPPMRDAVLPAPPPPAYQTPPPLRTPALDRPQAVLTVPAPAYQAPPPPLRTPALDPPLPPPTATISSVQPAP